MAGEPYGKYKRTECGDDSIMTDQDIINSCNDLWLAAYDLITRKDFWDTVNQAGIGLPGEYDTLKEYFEDD